MVDSDSNSEIYHMKMDVFEQTVACQTCKNVYHTKCLSVNGEPLLSCTLCDKK